MPPRASKRPRHSGPDEDAPASAPDVPPVPPLPQDEEPPPLPPAPPAPEDVEPPPPPPPAASSFIAPPPPPPADDEPPLPPSEDVDEEAAERLKRKRSALEALENDESVQQDASYWSRLASEREAAAAAAAASAQQQASLYLDTISRAHLDFDFERVCSVSLSSLHVYACLVCGKYFAGRGPRSWASKHAVDEDHRVWLKLDGEGKGNVYLLPEGTQVRDPASLSALHDIRYLMDPTFTERAIRRLDAPDARKSRDLSGNSYTPGFIGMNNIGGNDYMNVVIQALAHVKPLRDFFLRGRAAPVSTSVALQQQAYSGVDAAATSELAARFSMLVRKVWNARLFKPQVSPHELLQEVSRASSGKFSLTAQGDPVEFLGWLLNQLHTDLGGSRKRESIISATFRGLVRVESQKVFVRSGIELDDDRGGPSDKLDSDGRREGGQEDAQGKAKFNIDKEIRTDLSPFFLLAIDLPPPPVFQDVIEKNIIPQVPLATLISKYDGVTFQEARGMIRRFKVLRLPPFVILHYRRFTKNNFVEERNPTIVNFPVKGLDLSETVEGQPEGIETMYDLVANITHEATAGTVRDGQVWRVQVHSRVDGEPVGGASAQDGAARRKDKGKAKAEPNGVSGTGEEDDEDADKAAEEKWYQIQDLIVEDINRQMLFLGETYVQIWERRGGTREVEHAMRRIAAQQQAHAQKNAKPTLKPDKAGAPAGAPPARGTASNGSVTNRVA